MNKVYDLAEELTRTLSNKVNEISNDTTLDSDTKYLKMETYSEVINIISDVVRKVIDR